MYIAYTVRGKRQGSTEVYKERPTSPELRPNGFGKLNALW